ncbi:hypothetical protein AWW66_32235 [Micromonospora rosaria]|uniref:Uncharacterized protein n=2 Tax=Micromonospora rosaria TaxID=47874 RepID=A0A136PI20_9ACTN|nr:hypothetical protein AWW66_32235 [Micromonospora rosaria]
MSRQELAEAVNAYAYEHAGRRVTVDARYVGKLERGEHRWPFEPCRTALRQVLGKATNAEVGFFIIHGHAKDPDPDLAPPQTLSDMPAPAPDDTGGAAAVGRVVGDNGGGLVVPGGATVRVSLTVAAAQVRVVRDEGAAGRVAVLAGPVEVLIEPSDPATILAPVPARPSEAIDGPQVGRPADGRRQR